MKVFDIEKDKNRSSKVVLAANGLQVYLVADY
jgi:hypothetical protein